MTNPGVSSSVRCTSTLIELTPTFDIGEDSVRAASEYLVVTGRRR